MIVGPCGRYHGVTWADILIAPPLEAPVAARMALATEEGALSPRASSSRLLLEFLFMLVVFDIGVQKVLAR